MKTALVTGANRGIGFETSKQLAEIGFKVYMGCRSEEKGRIAAESLKSSGLDVEFVKLDVLSTKDVRTFIDDLKVNKVNLDVLVNNAGVFLESDGPEDKSTSSILKVDSVIILKTIETNTMGPLKLIQSILPKMLEQNSGRIINVSSGMGQLSSLTGHWPGYRMSKASLNVLTLMIADEFKNSNIIVNSVCPGWVKTDMGGQNASLSAKEGVDSIVWLASCDKSPNGKFISQKKVIDW